jgi:hypothetical protein
MSTIEDPGSRTGGMADDVSIDTKLEATRYPVRDSDRAKECFRGLPS